jgi:GT2 family glycosyltransferase
VRDNNSAKIKDNVKDITVSIIICTLDRPLELKNCLTALANQDTTISYEVIVADNNPNSNLTPLIVSDYKVRYVTEDRRGSSYARNAGIKASQGQLIVCLDDDVIVSPNWLDNLVKPFENPEVACVTGLVLPESLEAESARLFEEYGGLGRGLESKKFDKTVFKKKIGIIPTWQIGATASAAFRFSIFQNPAIGPFNETLGAGVATGCSEDTYLFYKILKAGYTCVYEPRAVVYHKHRQNLEELNRQIFNYSKGHVAYHLLTLIHERDWRVLPYLFFSLPRKMLTRFNQTRKKKSSYPYKLLLLECRGLLNGPLALYKAHRNVKKLGRTTPQEIELARKTS